jgi:hypothetical protein
MEMPVRKPQFGLTLLTIVSAACLLAGAAGEAWAVKAGGTGGTDGACLEAFHECQRGCGPSPSTANPACLRYCEEEVLAKCKAGGGGGAAAVKGGIAKPTVKGTLKKSAP